MLLKEAKEILKKNGMICEAADFNWQTDYSGIIMDSRAISHTLAELKYAVFQNDESAERASKITKRFAKLKKLLEDARAEVDYIDEYMHP